MISRENKNLDKSRFGKCTTNTHFPKTLGENLVVAFLLHLSFFDPLSSTISYEFVFEQCNVNKANAAAVTGYTQQMNETEPSILHCAHMVRFVVRLVFEKGLKGNADDLKTKNRIRNDNPVAFRSFIHWLTLSFSS